MTELRISGKVGYEAKQLFDGVISKIVTQVGIALEPYSDARESVLGTWKHLASYDESAPPGRARLHLRSQEEVPRVVAALDGQVLQVGADFLSLTVHNDWVESSLLAGGALGGR